MKESEIRQKIFCKLARRIKTLDLNPWDLDDFLANIFAAMYPYVRDGLVTESEQQKRHFELIKSFRTGKKNREFYDSLKESALIEAIKDKWLCTIADKASFAIFSIIEKISDGHLVIFKEKHIDSFFRISKDDDTVYGTDNYIRTVVKKEEPVLSPKPESAPIVDNCVESEEIFVEPEESASKNKHVFDEPKVILRETPKKKQKKDSDDEFHTNFADLRDIMLIEFAGKTKCLRELPFMWQYRLSKDSYEKLKELIQKNEVIKDSRRVNKCLSKNIAEFDEGCCTLALIIILFLSEWYKRESTSTRPDNCLSVNNLNRISPEKLWNNSGLPGELLHNAKGNSLWLMAISVLGGFPLQYVNSNKRFEKLINAISEIETEEDIDDVKIDSIADEFDNNNSVIKGSLRNGSCRSYLLQLAKYVQTDDVKELPFNKEDIEEEPFSSFVRNLKEGYENTIKSSFFRDTISVWTDDESPELESSYELQIGFKKNKNVITTRELYLLGVTIPSEATFFTLALDIENLNGSRKTVTTRRYNKIGNGINDFCGLFGSRLSADIDLLATKVIEVTIQFENQTERKVIHSFTIPSYFELYESNEAYCWTNITNHNVKKVILYNPESLYISNVAEDQLTILSKTSMQSQKDWRWFVQEDTIELADTKTGDVIPITLGNNEKIVIKFRSQSLRKAIHQSADLKVRCRISEEETEKVHLLCFNGNGKKAGDLNISCDGMEKKDLDNHYMVEYRSYTGARYTEWTKDNNPEQGLIYLRITCKDKASRKNPERILVYFIPEQNPIVRDLENHNITFKAKDVYHVVPNSKDVLLIKGKFTDKKEEGNEVKDNYVSFRIGKAYPYILVDIYRAFQLHEIYKNGKWVKGYFDTRSLDIPIAHLLASQTKVRIIDKDGPRWKNFEGEFPYHDFYVDPSENVNFRVPDTGGIYQIIYLEKYYDRTNDTSKERSVKIDRDKNSIELHVSDRYVHGYRFFYWSGEITDNLIELEHKNLGERTYSLQLPCALTQCAVVFQSKKDCTPNLYFRPFYPEEKWLFITNRFNTRNLAYRLKCFDIAAEHKIYFFTFPCLKMEKKEDMTDFLAAFLRRNNYILSKNDIDNLQRLAFENGTDWFLAKLRKIRRGGLTDEEKNKFRQSIEKLLLASPFAKDDKESARLFISAKFWNPDYNIRKSKKIIKQFLGYIKEPPSRNDQIAFLNSLREEHNIFTKIREILKY